MIRPALYALSVVAIVLAGPATLLAPDLTAGAYAQSSKKKTIRKLRKKVARLDKQRQNTNAEIQKTFPGRGSVTAKIRRTETNIGIIKARRDELEAAIRKAERGQKALAALKRKNRNRSANPYATGKAKRAGVKAGGFAATRALIKSTKTPVTLIAGFLIDGVEGAYRLHVKRRTDRDLDAFIKRNRISLRALLEVYGKINEDLLAEYRRRSKLKKLKARWDKQNDEWATAKLRLQRLERKQAAKKTPKKKAKKKSRKKKGRLKVTRCRRGSLTANLECATRMR